MSAPFALVRARAFVASVALVSVLHTSIAAYAQAPAAPAAPPAAAPSTPPPAAPARPTPAPAATTQAPAAPAQAPSTATPPQPAPAAPPSAPAPGTAAPGTVTPGTAADAALRERARAAYAAGKDAFTAGQYAAAASHFGEADALIPSIQAKYWRAMSIDRTGDVPGALGAFELVLASPDKAQLGADALATAEARQRALAATPAELTITTTPPGARVRVSGVDLSATTPTSVRLGPGRHVIQVSLPGYRPEQVEVDAAPGAKLAPSFTLVLVGTAPGAAPLSPPPGGALMPPPSTPVARSKVPGYVTLGIAGASAIVGTIFGIKALEDEKEFNDAPSTRRADDVERNALIADMAFGVTLTLGITGLVLLIADDPLPEQTTALRPNPGTARLEVTPVVSSKGAGAAATLTF